MDGRDIEAHLALLFYCGGPIRVGHIPEPDAIVVWQDDPWFPLASV